MHLRRHDGSALMHLPLLTTFRIISVAIGRAFQFDSANNRVPLPVCHFSHDFSFSYLLISCSLSLPFLRISLRVLL